MQCITRRGVFSSLGDIKRASKPDGKPGFDAIRVSGPGVVALNRGLCLIERGSFPNSVHGRNFKGQGDRSPSRLTQSLLSP